MENTWSSVKVQLKIWIDCCFNILVNIVTELWSVIEKWLGALIIIFQIDF